MSDTRRIDNGEFARLMALRRSGPSPAQKEAASAVPADLPVDEQLSVARQLLVNEITLVAENLMSLREAWCALPLLSTGGVSSYPLIDGSNAREQIYFRTTQHLVDTLLSVRDSLPWGVAADGRRVTIWRKAPKTPTQPELDKLMLRIEPMFSGYAVEIFDEREQQRANRFGSGGPMIVRKVFDYDVGKHLSLMGSPVSVTSVDLQGVLRGDDPSDQLTISTVDNVDGTLQPLTKSLFNHQFHQVPVAGEPFAIRVNVAITRQGNPIWPAGGSIAFYTRG